MHNHWKIAFFVFICLVCVVSLCVNSIDAVLAQEKMKVAKLDNIEKERNIFKKSLWKLLVNTISFTLVISYFLHLLFGL